MLRNTAEAADSSPGMPAVIRQCFTNWLFRNLGAFQESSSATLLQPIREDLPVTRAAIPPPSSKILCSEGFLEECNDLSVEVEMKRMPVESRTVGADLRSLLGQCFAAGRKEHVVPCSCYYMFVGRLRKFLPD